ncbi:MAG: hypothetical protein CL759_06985 [Chloroflexi bacterium]|nr:hypothetical protein [Chloroflexota bacterium]
MVGDFEAEAAGKVDKRRGEHVELLDAVGDPQRLLIRRGLAQPGQLVLAVETLLLGIDPTHRQADDLLAHLGVLLRQRAL